MNSMKYEYTELVTPKGLREEMNNLGSEGWVVFQARVIFLEDPITNEPTQKGWHILARREVNA